ncbi:phospholipase [Grimontia hollisae]|nr:phospholipase [Grimontia hollisae]
MVPGYDLPYLWDNYAGYTNQDWMRAIDGNKRLSEISIPGTHNSLSMHGGDIPATQTLDVADQLEMGIRYLDVRFKYRNNDLWAYHGPISQHQTFDSLLSKVSNFLARNPSETVLIRIQNEGGASDHEHQFFNRFNQVLEQYKHYNAIPKSNNPLLDDVRGKFVFIRDFNVFGSHIGIERSSLNIQDEYHLTTNWDLYKKWELVKQHFYSIDKNRLSLNYLSGSVGSFPYFVASGKSSPQSHAPQLWTGISTTNAKKYPDFPRRSCLGDLCSIYFSGTNQLTNKWIEEAKLPQHLGIVVMDFPGGRLVDNIIQSNGKSKVKSLIIYEHNDQQGKSLAVFNDMPYVGNEFNDIMSSWEMPSNWEVRFYEHENYQGDYYTRSSMKGNADMFNDKISSIRILKK